MGCGVLFRSEEHSYLLSYFLFFSHFKRATHAVTMHKVMFVQMIINIIYHHMFFKETG